MENPVIFFITEPYCLLNCTLLPTTPLYFPCLLIPTNAYEYKPFLFFFFLSLSPLHLCVQATSSAWASLPSQSNNCKPSPSSGSMAKTASSEKSSLIPPSFWILHCLLTPLIRHLLVISIWYITLFVILWASHPISLISVSSAALSRPQGMAGAPSQLQ